MQKVVCRLIPISIILNILIFTSKDNQASLAQ